MKRSLLLSMAAAIVLAGCGKSQTPAPTTTSASPTTATNTPPPSSADYLGALGQAQQSSERKIDTAYLTQAIQQFNAAEGRFPTNLQELVPTYIAKIPEAPNGYQLNYDSTAGTVTVVKQ